MFPTVLQRLVESRGKPSTIRVDNGSKFVSDQLRQWCEDYRIKLSFIQPGKSVQNAFVERNDGSLRPELLDAYLLSLKSWHILTTSISIPEKANHCFS